MRAKCSSEPVHSDKIIEFEDLEVDLTRGELRRGVTPIGAEPQVFDLIPVLSASPGEKAIAEAESALALDPKNARAPAVISWAYFHFYNKAFAEDSGTVAQLCSDAARASDRCACGKSRLTVFNTLPKNR